MENISTSWETIKVSDGTDMRCFVACSEKPTAGIIALPEIFGVNHHMQEEAARLASLGYIVLVPELFHRTAEPGWLTEYKDMDTAKAHMQKLTNKGIEDDVKAAFDYLSKTVGDNIASVGYCLGGKCSYIANGVLRLKAAASYYGTGIYPVLNDYADKQHAPLLLFWGGKDINADAEKRSAIYSALDQHKKVFRQVVFSDASHAFSNNDRENYNANATQEAWGMLTAFFRNYLKA